MLSVGSEGSYDWLVSDQQFDLLRLCPQIVLGNTLLSRPSIEESSCPTEKEAAVGWQNRGKIAYSPQVQSIEEIPSAGWDEWYIFDGPTDLGTSHLAENIFEVPQEQGPVSALVNTASPCIRRRGHTSPICFGRRLIGFDQNPTWRITTI